MAERERAKKLDTTRADKREQETSTETMALKDRSPTWSVSLEGLRTNTQSKATLGLAYRFQVLKVETNFVKIRAVSLSTVHGSHKPDPFVQRV